MKGGNTHTNKKGKGTTMNNNNEKSYIKTKEGTMKTISRSILWALLLLSVAAMAIPQQASAAGTASGVTISNKATVNYSVNSVAQAAIGSSPTGNSSGVGTATTFVVDNKVNLTIAANSAGYVVTLPGQQKAIKFTLSNIGNTTQDYLLSSIPDPNNTLVPAAITLYSNSGCAVSGTWDAGCTVIAGNRVSNLAADGTSIVYVVITAPATPVNGQVANYALKAVTYDAGGGAITAQTVGANTAGVDVVFADGDGDGARTDDASRDGLYVTWHFTPTGATPTAGFQISSSSLTITKAVTVYSDPFNGTSNPKAIPGAIMTYTVTIANGGTADATNVSIVDDLTSEVAAHVSFVTQFNDGTGSGCSTAGKGISVGGTCLTNVYAGNDGASWDDTGDPLGAGGKKVVVSGQTVAQGTSLIIKYQVQVTP
jgi:uncharacterized repeat protein (TIGR01451 family)